MALITIENTDLSSVFTSTDHIDLQNQHVLEFQARINTLNNFIPMSTLLVDQVGIQAVFKFELTTSDGRQWSQRLNAETPVDRFANTGNPVDFWDLGEEQYILAIRFHVFKLVRAPLHLVSAHTTWAQS